MNIRTLAIAAVGLGVVAYAPAGLAGPKGPFVGIMGGANFTGDQDFRGTGADINRTVKTDTGWAVIPSVGYRYGNGVRAEFELGYRSNDVDKLTGIGGAAGAGKMTAKSAMVNLLYDMDTGSRLMPYVGAGLGIARVDEKKVRPVGAATNRVNDDDDVFAYQSIAGLSYWVNESVELAAEYRYFATQDPKLHNSAGVRVKSEYDSHAALVGLRLNFGGPKAAPEPVAAAVAAPPPALAAVVEPPALPRSFLVFFDWDRSGITAEADSVLRDAAAYAKTTGAVKIGAAGHADRSGRVGYNMALSKRRADAVRARLLALGVPESEIGVAAKGESDPLVPTEDGVREPQNRRVEIVLN